MPLLARDRDVVLDTSGNPIVGASVQYRRQGAQVNGTQSGTTPLTVTVRSNGAIVAGDTVSIVDATTNALGTATFNVDSTTETTVVLSGFSGSLTLNDKDRISPGNNLLTLYSDIAVGTTQANPLTTDSKGTFGTWLRAGRFDRYISGGTSTLGANTNTAFTPDVFGQTQREFRPDDSVYGAKFDGSTDDGAAIRAMFADAALAASGSADGAIAIFPPGTAMTSLQIEQPNNVEVFMSGPRTTIIKATAGFPTSTAVWHQGSTTDGLGIFEYGMMLHGGQIDCNGVTGSIGIRSSYANQGSGLDRVLVVNSKGTGVIYRTNFCQNITIRDLEVNHAAGATTNIGLDLNNCGPAVQVDGYSCNGNDASTVSTNQGIKINTDAGTTLRRIHIERYAIGVELTGTTPTASIDTIDGLNSVTDLIKINAARASLHAVNIRQSGATNAVNDARSGGVGAISLNEGGFFILSQDGASAATDTLLTSSTTVASRYNSPITFAGTVTYSTHGGAIDINSDSTVDAVWDMKRAAATRGTTHVTGDYALSAGFGTTASIAFFAGFTPTDHHARIIITSSGTGQGANPTLTLTFKDGAWSRTPHCITQRMAGDQMTVELLPTVMSTTSVVFTFSGTPVAGQTYDFTFLMLG